MARVTFLSALAILASWIFAFRRDSDTETASPAVRAERDGLEASILSSTVRFQIDYWIVNPDESGDQIDNTVGHGTVKDGRYLVTHNHFGTPFEEDPGVAAEDIYSRITIYNAYGFELRQMDATSVSIAARDEEMLILDFGESGGTGFFEALGLSSASFQERQPGPGAEVAQVDWDGLRTRIDWVTVKEVTIEDGVRQVVLSDGAMPGASGGGVFLNGQHIANNWTLMEHYGISGALVDQYSTAALNTSLVTVSWLLRSPPTEVAPAGESGVRRGSTRAGFGG